MGLNLNYTKPDGQAANYWKISRVEDWFQGTDPESSQYMANVNSLGFTNETYRDAGAPSVDGNMFTCNYASGTDFYPYYDLTGASGTITGSERAVPLPDGWDPIENGVSGWMQRSDDI